MKAHHPELTPLIGVIVKRRMADCRLGIGAAARNMGISEPTLRQIRDTGYVPSDRFYAGVEEEVGIPAGLLLAMRDGDLDTVRELYPDLPLPLRRQVAAVVDPEPPKRSRKAV